MKIRELLDIIEERVLPLIYEDETIKEVLRKMIDNPHTRLIHVIDKKHEYKGVISLDTLIKHLFPYCFEPPVIPRSLIPMITAKTAKDIMNKGFVYATNEDTVDEVIDRMIRAGVNEIAILDDGKRIIADLTMLDLIKHCHLNKNDIDE